MKCGLICASSAAISATRCLSNAFFSRVMESWSSFSIWLNETAIVSISSGICLSGAIGSDKFPLPALPIASTTRLIERVNPFDSSVIIKITAVIEAITAIIIHCCFSLSSLTY